MLISGYALNCTVASAAMVKRVQNAKIACLDFGLMKARMKLGIQIVVDDPNKLDAIRERESDITKEMIKKILNAGANVVLTTGGIDDLCLKLNSTDSAANARSARVWSHLAKPFMRVENPGDAPEF